MSGRYRLNIPDVVPDAPSVDDEKKRVPDQIFTIKFNGAKK